MCLDTLPAAEGTVSRMDQLGSDGGLADSDSGSRLRMELTEHPGKEA